MMTSKASINKNELKDSSEEDVKKSSTEKEEIDMNSYFKKQKTWKYKISSFFRNFKDFLLLLILLSSSISNFSLSNIPYTLCGVLFMFLLLNHDDSSSKTKFTTVIVMLIYSFITIIFKTVILTLDKMDVDPVSDFVYHNKSLMMDLGLKYLEDEEEFVYYLNTFLCDGLVVFGVISYLIIKCIYKSEDETLFYEATVNLTSFTKISTIFICSVSLITLGITCANISFISIFYSILIHLGLFLWSINKSSNYNRMLYFILCFLFVVHIILTHTFNIYALRKKYMVGSSDIKIIKWMGIMKMRTHVDFFLDFLLSVVGSCICIVAIKIRRSYNENSKSFLESTANSALLDEHKTLWTKTKDSVVKYIKSPYFLLHFCRLAVVYWTWRFVNFPTIGLLFWLFYSFVIIHARRMKYVTMLVGWPLLIYSYNAFMITNIEGLLDDYINADNKEIYKQFALEKFEIPLIDFVPVQMTILIFAVLMRFICTENPKRKIRFKRRELRENLIASPNDDKSETSSKRKNENSIFNLISKFIITNIDKITLIFMYFIAIQKVNISHFILTIIFFIQLIIPGTIKKICLLIILSIAFIFAFEFIFDIVKIYITIDEDLNNKINLFIEFSKDKFSTEFFLPFIIYCFYIQYQNYNSSIYKSYNSSRITFNGYLEQLLKNHDNVKSAILYIIICIQEIYIWIILILLFCCICAFDLYLSFAVKLILFSFVIYQYLNMSKYHNKAEKILKYVWVLIVYCGINTIVVCFYQFTVLKYVTEWYNGFEEGLPDWLAMNLANIGLERYTESTAVKFLPHYASNLLSVLLLWELNRILNLKKEVTRHRNSNEMINFQSIGSNDKTLNTLAVNRNSEYKKVNYFKYYFYQFLIFTCITYWLIIFLSLCLFITVYQISLAMIIYILIFSVSFIFMFYPLISSVNKFLTKSNIFFHSRLIRFTIVEKTRNIKILGQYRKKTFKYLLFSGMTYITLTYLYTIFDNVQNKLNNYPIVAKDIEEIIKCCAYLMGVFHDFNSKSNFISTIWGHILMISLISFDIYIQKLQDLLNKKVDEIQKIMKVNEKIEKEKSVEKKLRNFSRFKMEVVGSSNKEEIDLNNRESQIVGSLKSAMSLIEEKESTYKNYDPSRLSNNNAEKTPIFNKNFSALPKEVKSNPVIVKFLSIFKNFEENKANDFYFPQCKNTSMTVTISLKKAAEELISFLILLSAIIKLNIISLFYILLVLYLQLRGKTLSRIYNTSIVISSSIIIQAFIFLSNLSINTDPVPNKEMLSLINRTLNIPWYTGKVNDSWGFFYSLGVNYYQIKTLWVEFIVIISSFIYLDNFCYSIYDGKEKDNSMNKVNYFIFREKKSVKKSVRNLTEEEYDELRVNLKSNFDINLIGLSELKDKILINSDIDSTFDLMKMRSPSIDKRSLYSAIIQNKNKKKGRCKLLFVWAKKTLYLTMHNSVLVITLILSMMNTGLISVFYIIFSLYYLYNSNNIVQAKPYSFPKKIDKFLRIFFLLDLFIQLIYQNPLNVYLKDYEFILISIGINKTIDYENGPESSLFKLKYSILDVLKAVTYFFISLQVMIYSSKDFKEFYIGFIIKKKDAISRNSMINAFLLNNKRIETMERSVNRKKQIDKVLNELECQLEKWSKKLSGSDNNEEDLKEVKEIESGFSSDTENVRVINVNPVRTTSCDNYGNQNENEIKNKIKAKIMKGWLINFVINIHQRTTNYSFIEKENKQELESAIVRGETYIKSIIEKKIDKFIDELDIKDLQIEEFNKIIENEEEAVDKAQEINEKENETKSGNIGIYRPSVQNVNKSPIKSRTSMNPSIVKSPLEQIDLKKYKHILKNTLFQKYLTKSYMIRLIFWNFSKFLMDNFQYVCFLLMLINNFLYASLISLFWPVAVFGFGLIEYPRPGRRFWRICRIYSSFLLVIKFVIQFNFIKSISALMNVISYMKNLKIGIEVFKETYSTEFLYYIIFDAILIFFLMMQEYILIARGLWDNIESEIESVEDANDRIFKARATNNTEYVEKILTKSKFNKKIKEVNSNTSYYGKMFPRIRNYKPGKDYYAYYTVTEIIIIVYLIFFYTDMDQDNMFKVAGTSTTRQFSGTVVLIAFFHAIKAVLDRIIYLQQSRNNLEFEYVYYNKETGERLSEMELSELGISCPKDVEMSDSIGVIYYQKEQKNYPLICKYILQMIIIFLSHIFIFFFLPMIGNLNLQNSIYCEGNNVCNDFSYNLYIQLFYIIYCIYLFFSSLQIYYGLSDMRDKSLLMRGDNIIYSSMFKGYNAIPFLYELKLTIDWTCTPTCLDLFKWLKFESVYDLLFITQCAKKVEMNVPIGRKIGNVSKLLIGGSSFVLLLAILLGPLLLFSTLNPTNQVNNVTGANVELSICFQQGERVFNNFTLFKNDYVESIQDMSTNNDIWKLYGYYNSSKTKNFPMRQVQVISMSNTSDTIWDIAGPHIQTIKDRLENYRNNSYSIYIGFKYSFQRPSPTEARDSVKKFDYPLYIPNKVDRADFINVLTDDIKYCNKTDLVLENFYNPALRLSSQSHPKVIWDNEVFKNITVVANFICDYNEGIVDYTKSYYTLRKLDEREDKPSVIFHTFSDKVSQTSTAYDVVTFYISFIIVIGRVIRGVISGEAEKIILTEMPEPISLVNLCEGIKVSRYRFDFEREEYLYNILIDFMRSPELLKLLTKSSLKKFQERKLLNKK